ncbi:pentapeptide repeat-containing protein [Streptomyces sp. AV19]|uniref:pentapeptide repeat-containing protein n=1 Tax=Streptomyces sp. AV19 TaxID=2793068 RepID=UPI0018FE822F|nr:pentapeptide repeat-containing protein [Streptomyces sp. AV19]MBH1934779.1 pentapeptide repeat-containing protein [Streptomyces sp. AV19]MDG4530614.1 pentapeptide repeat-containing protein [Streptomyces sp. AV19]
MNLRPAGPPRASAPPPADRVARVIRDEDWHGRRLTPDDRHERHTFLDTDWTEVENEGAVFEECDFAGVRFNASRHTGAAFVNCTFRDCTFFDTKFTDCKFAGSRFQGAAFTLLEVSGGDWSFTDLAGADLRGAVFDRVRMREADLTAARLEGATLTRTDLSSAALHNSRLTGADLRGSDIGSLDPRTVDLSDALVDLTQAAAIVAALGLKVEEMP